MYWFYYLLSKFLLLLKPGEDILSTWKYAIFYFYLDQLTFSPRVSQRKTILMFRNNSFQCNTRWEFLLLSWWNWSIILLSLKYLFIEYWNNTLNKFNHFQLKINFLTTFDSEIIYRCSFIVSELMLFGCICITFMTQLRLFLGIKIYTTYIFVCFDMEILVFTILLLVFIVLNQIHWDYYYSDIASLLYYWGHID